MVQKNIDIIPIRYISGTGGQFLSNFITAAKNNNKHNIALSVHGNAHQNNLSDFIIPKNSAFGPCAQHDPLNIDAMLKLTGKEGSVPVYYPAMHLMNIELLLNTFDKVISIVYDIEDISDIALIFYGKFYLDEPQSNNNISFSHRYVTTKITLKYSHRFFKEYESDNVLNVSWKELFHLDTNILVRKISAFTRIPEENFNISNLLEWREATSQCLDKVSSTLNT
jgi:hypothetical protein